MTTVRALPNGQPIDVPDLAKYLNDSRGLKKGDEGWLSNKKIYRMLRTLQKQTGVEILRRLGAREVIVSLARLREAGWDDFGQRVYTEGEVAGLRADLREMSRRLRTQGTRLTELVDEAKARASAFEHLHQKVNQHTKQIEELRRG